VLCVCVCACAVVDLCVCCCVLYCISLSYDHFYTLPYLLVNTNQYLPSTVNFYLLATNQHSYTNITYTTLSSAQLLSVAVLDSFPVGMHVQMLEAMLVGSGPYSSVSLPRGVVMMRVL
jgi:hypothetical protein